MKTAAHRVVFRVELEANTVKEFEKLSTDTGITRIALASKLLHWFSTQPPGIQANILGMYGAEAAQAITGDILKNIADQAGASR